MAMRAIKRGRSASKPALEHLYFAVVDAAAENSERTAEAIAGWLPRSRHAKVWRDEQLAELLVGEQPDLVIAELELPWLARSNVVQAIRQRWPTCTLIVFSQTKDPELAAAAMRRGADDFLRQAADAYPKLRAAIETSLWRKVDQRLSWKRRYAWLARTLEALPRGLAVFSCHETLELYNRAFPKLLPLGSVQLSPGLSLESVLTACVRSGELSEAMGREEAWIAECSRALRDLSGSWKAELQTGRTLGLTSHWLASGELVLIVSDITERTNLEEALAESNDRFRDFAESASDWLWETDAELRFTFRSERAGESLGGQYRDMIGCTRWELAGADPDRDPLWRAHVADMKAHRPFRDFRYVADFEGQRLHLRISGVPVFGADGQFRGYRGTATDETAQQTAQQRADDAEARLRTLAENLPGAIYQRQLGTDGAVSYPYVSAGIEALIGYTAVEIRQRPERFFGAIHPEDTPAFRAQLLESAQRLTPMDLQLRMRRRDDSTIWVRIIARPRRLSDGAVIWESVCIDVTAQRRLEQSFRQLIEAAPLAVLLVDGDGRITLANAHSETLFGCQRAAIVGHSVEELVPESSRARHRQHRVRYLADAEPRPMGGNRALQAQRADGSLVDTEVALAPVDLPNGRQTMVLLTDLTERRRMEQQLLHTQKLESIGQLAAGIAHEINTPSQYVSDNLQFLQDAFADLLELQEAQRVLRAEAVAGGMVSASTLQTVDAAVVRADLDYLLAEVPRALQQSVEGMQRISHIVVAMKEFSHPGGADKSAVELARLITNAVTVARNEWKYVAELETDFDSALGPVPCHPDELGQVVLNLVVNAAQAIAERQAGSGNGGGQRGRIQVSLARMDPWAEIRIADNGPGIPESIQHRIFDPFFTTKAVGKGTGQGLAIAHHVVVQKHQGTISLHSTVGQGSTFVVRIPLNAVVEVAGEAGEGAA